jgi:purine-nucleoside phosphorylase
MELSACFCLGTFEKTPSKECAAAVAVDHINLSGWNPLIGENDKSLGPRFPDMSEVYNEHIRECLKTWFKKNIDVEFTEKVLVGVQDPSILSDSEKQGLSELENYIYTDRFIFEAIVANYANFKVCTLFLNRQLALNKESEKKIVQYFASLDDNYI